MAEFAQRPVGEVEAGVTVQECLRLTHREQFLVCTQAPCCVALAWTADSPLGVF